MEFKISTADLPNMHLSQSQYHQDFWVLKTLNYKRNGFFLDVGAAHWQKLSNTYYLETEFGWNGICIEGNAPFYNDLVKNRKATCVNKYVSTHTNLTYINLSPRTPDDPLDKGFGDFLDEYNTGITPSVQRNEIRPELLMNILDKNNAPPLMDYLSIDIEGADFPVLKTIDFNKYNFRTITIEDNIPSITWDIINFLLSKGYDLAGKICGLDLAFVYREDV